MNLELRGHISVKFVEPQTGRTWILRHNSCHRKHFHLLLHITVLSISRLQLMLSRRYIMLKLLNAVSSSAKTNHGLQLLLTELYQTVPYWKSNACMPPQMNLWKNCGPLTVRCILVAATTTITRSRDNFSAVVVTFVILCLHVPWSQSLWNWKRQLYHWSCASNTRVIYDFITNILRKKYWNVIYTDLVIVTVDDAVITFYQSIKLSIYSLQIFIIAYSDFSTFVVLSNLSWRSWVMMSVLLFLLYWLLLCSYVLVVIDLL